MIRFKFCLHLQRHIYELRLICYAPRFSFMHGGHFLDDDPSLFEKLNCTGAVFLPVTQIGTYANVDNSHKSSYLLFIANSVARFVAASAFSRTPGSSATSRSL